MTRTTYDPGWTMEEARAHYFAVNGFGADGGYSDAWVDFKLGPIPFPFPNTQARLRALAVHDLHHIVTDYDTDFVGELQISAWELGAGCRSFFAAWFLNLAGLAGGVLFAPARTYRAFSRGRSSQSLYGRDVDALLRRTVAETKRDLGTDGEPPPARAGDVVSFGACVAAGAVCAAVFMVVGVALLPFGLAASALGPRRVDA
jgi:hypothetical protein